MGVRVDPGLTGLQEGGGLSSISMLEVVSLHLKPSVTAVRGKRKGLCGDYICVLFRIMCFITEDCVCFYERRPDGLKRYRKKNNNRLTCQTA